MSVTVRLEGFHELDAQFAKLSKATGRNVLRRALLSAAQPLARKMRTMAPRGQTYNLVESIEVSTVAKDADPGTAAYATTLASGGSKGAAVSAMRGARRSSGLSTANVYVGPTKYGFYGMFQEFGTINHGPQPFVRPAFDQDRDDVLMRLKVELWDELGKAVTRAERRAAKRA